MESKISELQSIIENKNKEIYMETVQALKNNDQNSYKHLQSLQIQCQAELRLLHHLKSGADNKSFVVC